MKSRWTFAIAAIVAAGPAAASDPTPLFVLFVGVPAVLLAVAGLALAWLAPRAGRAYCIALLVVHLPVMIWAGQVGYMERAGLWLFASLMACVGGIVLAGAKLDQAGSRDDKRDQGGGSK